MYMYIYMCVFNNIYTHIYMCVCMYINMDVE